jgi:hypothetical protein
MELKKERVATRMTVVVWRAQMRRMMLKEGRVVIVTT